MASSPSGAPLAGPRAGRFVRACFGSVPNAVLSLAVVAASVYLAADAVRWAVLDATWSGSSGRDCGGAGACWIFIRDRWGQILYGPYPPAERWRVDLAALLGAIGLGLLVRRSRAGDALPAAIGFVAYAVGTGVLLRGGTPGLPAVPTAQWGGLMLTLIVAAWTIVTAVPLGLLLALARRSPLPVVAGLAAGFIDVVRSLPLLGLLFLVIVMFPFFVPAGVEIDKLLRALVAFSLFNAANFAEVFRGALQTLPRGQTEAALALGLDRTKATWLVVVPQVVALSIPGIVNVCISIIKETTIVLIVGLFDFLGVLQAGLSDPRWLDAPTLQPTVYAFAGAVFGTLCFSLSTYSRRLERRLERAR